jgi:hypothetical protein
MSSSREDFIPLDKSAKKRKHHHDSHRSSTHKTPDRDREKSTPSLKSEARCPKLRERICKYLEENRFKVKRFPAQLNYECPIISVE